MIKDQEWVLWYFFTDPRQRLPAWKIIPSVVKCPDFSTVLFTPPWVSTAIIRLVICPVPDRSVSTIIIFEKIISSETTKDEKIFITSKITDDKISFLAWLIHWIYGSTNSVAVKNKLQQNAKQNLVKKISYSVFFVCLFVFPCQEMMVVLAGVSYMWFYFCYSFLTVWLTHLTYTNNIPSLIPGDNYPG